MKRYFILLTWTILSLRSYLLCYFPARRKESQCRSEAASGKIETRQPKKSTFRNPKVPFLWLGISNKEVAEESGASKNTTSWILSSLSANWPRSWTDIKINNNALVHDILVLHRNLGKWSVGSINSQFLWCKFRKTLVNQDFNGLSVFVTNRSLIFTNIFALMN